MSSRWTVVAGLVLLTVGAVLTVRAQTSPAPGSQPATSPPAAAIPAPAKNRPPGTPPSDLELVEKLLGARKDYQVSLEQLRAHYVSVGDTERARWAEEELKQFHRINKQAYRLELDVPPPTLKAEYNIPEANELYRRAMSYKDKGGWSNDSLDNQRRAELLLQQLLTSHPQSDKIGDAAYQLGDLYEGKAFLQYRRAAAYFERCFQWTPNTQLDARIRAARLYDKTLNERNRAIEIYREITTHETDPKRMQEAQKRLAELTGAK
jgi:tetratricopeptide (TPR) repeat protein